MGSPHGAARRAGFKINCPNCGAPRAMSKLECRYCDTPWNDGITNYIKQHQKASEPPPLFSEFYKKYYEKI